MGMRRVGGVLCRGIGLGLDNGSGLLAGGVGCEAVGAEDRAAVDGAICQDEESLRAAVAGEFEGLASEGVDALLGVGVEGDLDAVVGEEVECVEEGSGITPVDALEWRWIVLVAAAEWCHQERWEDGEDEERKGRVSSALAAARRDGWRGWYRSCGWHGGCFRCCGGFAWYRRWASVTLGGLMTSGGGG